MKISKGTIIRTIALAVVLFNLFLKAIGKPLIEFDEATAMYWLEYFIEVAVIIVAFWKNNSFSPAAIKADSFLKKLREEGSEAEIIENTESEVNENGNNI